MDDELDFLWEIIANNYNFEVIAYLIVSQEDGNNTWFLTPKTRDGQRDGEGHGINGVNFFEAKFFEGNNNNLQLTKVGTNILIAIYGNVRKLYIFTNGNISPDLIKFIEKHRNSSHNANTDIILFDKRQTAISILKHSNLNLDSAIKEIQYINYRSLSKIEIDNYIEANQTVAKNILQKIKDWKDTSSNKFILNPTVKNFIDSGISVSNHTIQSFLHTKIHYNTHSSNENSIIVAVGKPFTFYLTISNYFLDSLECRIKIKTKTAQNHFEIINCDFITQNEYYTKNINLEPLKNNIIAIKGKFYDNAYTGLEIDISYLLSKDVLIKEQKEIVDEISLNNKVFYGHYFGSNNIAQKHNFNTIIDQLYREKIYGIRLIKGGAGVGKSRFIDEILFDVNSITLHQDILKCVIGQDDFINILEKTLSLTLCIDYNSFVDIVTQIGDIDAGDESQLNYLFSSQNEKTSFCSLIRDLCQLDQSKLTRDDVKSYAEAVGKIILKFHRNLTILIFEDIHRSSQNEFQFILDLNSYILKHCVNKTVFMLLATRSSFNTSINNNTIENESYGSNYNYFETELTNYYKNSIIVKLENLSDEDSRAMVYNYFYNSEPNQYIERIRVLCGNNPFCIIHTLIQLKNLDIISFYDDSFLHLTQINRLNTIYDVNIEINEIFKNRFDYYKRHEYHVIIFNIVHILVIFKSGIEYAMLKKIIYKNKGFDIAFRLLDEERIIIFKEGIVKFEHENLFIYASNNLMTNSGAIADRAYRFICNNSAHNIHNSEEYMVRALFWGTSKYKTAFFEKSKKYFDSLINNDLCEKSIFYGELILKKNEVSPYPLDKIYVEMKVISYQSASDNIKMALNRVISLHEKVKQSLNNSNIVDPQLYDLYLEICLEKADLEIHDSQNIIAEKSFKALLTEINKRPRCNIENNRKHEIKSWIYNRLGVIDMHNKKYSKSKRKYAVGLCYARKAKHDYYIHHNYYDLCKAELFNGNDKDMLKYLNLANTKLLDQNKYKNAKVRTMIQEALIRFAAGEKDIINDLEGAIDRAFYDHFFYEANRGLLYLASIYLYEKKLVKSNEIFIKALKFSQIGNAQRLKIGIYSGYIFCCYHNYLSNGSRESLEEAFSYYKEMLEFVFDKNGLIAILNFWNELVIHNLKILDGCFERDGIYLNQSTCNMKYVAIQEQLKKYKLEIDPNTSRFIINVDDLEERTPTPYYVIFS